MNILVTAFEPFNHQAKNSSLEVLSKLTHPNITKKILPVTYEGCVRMLKETILEVKPDFVLCLGQYGGANTLRIEKVGLNYTRSTVADNAGVILTKGEVKRGGREAFFTSLEIESLVSTLNQQIPMVLSLSAGSFICNSTYYTALDEMQGKALFIHLPYYEGQGDDLTPTLPLEEMVKAIESVLAQLSLDR